MEACLRRYVHKGRRVVNNLSDGTAEERKRCRTTLPNATVHANPPGGPIANVSSHVTRGIICNRRPVEAPRGTGTVAEKLNFPPPHLHPFLIAYFVFRPVAFFQDARGRVEGVCQSGSTGRERLVSLCRPTGEGTGRFESEHGDEDRQGKPGKETAETGRDHI